MHNVLALLQTKKRREKELIEMQLGCHRKTTTLLVWHCIERQWFASSTNIGWDRHSRQFGWETHYFLRLDPTVDRVDFWRWCCYAESPLHHYSKRISWAEVYSWTHCHTCWKFLLALAGWLHLCRLREAWYVRVFGLLAAVNDQLR